MDKKKNLLEIETHMILSKYMDIISLCFGITKDPKSGNFMIVMGYAKDGSLRQHLNNSFNSTKWNGKLNILQKIAQGLDSIHQKGLIHRDFHCEPKNGEYSESLEAIDFTKLDDKSS
ncbi:kinase-like domain-containing protein [Rhizophagus irregularis DAOM 181602=DAOM 197198]|nr:kinase-like domain-containing protein [Rhizophagus irregularis DAOM 181602=DAOM 197198]